MLPERLAETNQNQRDTPIRRMRSQRHDSRAAIRCPAFRRIVHNRNTMALLWNPESWAQRLAELEAQSGDLKEAPLRRDVRSLGTLLGVVLREQAGDEHLLK